MKSHVADYKTRIYCIRVEPPAGTPIRLAAYPMPIRMSNGNLYRTETGYDFTGLAGESSLAATSIDLSGILQAGLIDKADIMSGVYNNARVYLFATSWKFPIEDEEPLALFFWGKVETTDEKFKVQLMGALDAISQKPGRTYMATCPWTFLDQSLDGFILPPNRSRCTGPRLAPDGPSFAALKVSGTTSIIFGRYTFTVVGITLQANDYFGNGAIRFITGANAFLKPLEIKRSEQYDEGAFFSTFIEVHEAFQFDIAPGDVFEMLPGCRKRRDDCRGKWNNILNFGGQPDIPTPTQYNQVGRGQ